MEQSKRNVIAQVLKKLSFVNWDRYFGEEDLTFFGWIDREDNYKDFLVLNFFSDGGISFSTSSAEHTKEIADILNLEHSDCHRIEYFCDLDNVIKEK